MAQAGIPRWWEPPWCSKNDHVKSGLGLFCISYLLLSVLPREEAVPRLLLQSCAEGSGPQSGAEGLPCSRACRGSSVCPRDLLVWLV